MIDLPTRGIDRRRLLTIGGIAIGLSALLAFLYATRVDDKAELDRQIQENWIAGHDLVDAWEFFQKGGVYENDTSRPAARDIDQKYVIPLIKTLREKHRLKVMAILQKDDPKLAMALIVEAPPDRESRNKVRATILESVADFPGLAMQNWSHRWVSLDFLDEDEIIPFREAGALEQLQVSQRTME